MYNSGLDMTDSSSDAEDRYPPNYPGGGRDPMGRNPHQIPESDSEYFGAGMHRPAHRHRGRDGRDAFSRRRRPHPESDSENFPVGMHPPARHDRYGGVRHDMGRTPWPNTESDSEGFSDGIYGGPPEYGSPFGGPGPSSFMPTRDTFSGDPRGRMIYSPFRGYIEAGDCDSDTSEAWSDDGPTDLPFIPRGGQGYNDPMRHPDGRFRQSAQRPRGPSASEGHAPLTMTEIVEISSRIGRSISVIEDQAERGNLYGLQGDDYIFHNRAFLRDLGVTAGFARDAGVQFDRPGGFR